ncbi:MAG: adenosylcobinamide-GDP ribazoletransferase [Panacagrimonas sp.]
MSSLIRQELRRALIAVGYFTRIPIPAWVGWSAFELNRSARYFPLVGAGVGLVGATVLGLASLVLPATLAVVLSMIATIVLTGAFHEDGLADAADGFGGGYEPQRVLSIMQDSRIGSFAAVALSLVLLAKFSALVSLLGMGIGTAATVLAVAHAASRAGALGVMAALPHVRAEDSSKAKPVAEGIGPAEWGTGILLGLLPLALAVVLDRTSPGSAALALAAAVVVPVLAARYYRRRIGGYTGDCLGATQQASELAIYIAFCAQLA